MMKKLFFFLFLGSIGAALYFGGNHELGGLTFFSTEKGPAKKVSAVKPKNFYKDRKTHGGGSSYGNENFSFFKVLNDPSLDVIVGLNGEVINAHRSRPVRASVETASIREPVPALPNRVAGNNSYKTVPTIIPFQPKKTVSRPGPEPVEVKNADSKTIVELPTVSNYAVQVSSFKLWERAETLRDHLAGKGYASFIGKTELPDNQGTWHRVYIGRYRDRAGAERDAAKFLREEKRPAMVVRRTG